jgi:hypothetical protein
MRRKLSLFLICAFEIALILFVAAWTAWAVSEEKFSEALSVAKLDAAVVAIRDNCVREIGEPETTRECKCAINYAKLENKLAFEIQYKRCVEGEVSDKTEDELKAGQLTNFLNFLFMDKAERDRLLSGTEKEEDGGQRKVLTDAQIEKMLSDNAKKSNSTNPINLAEIDAIRRHISSCWSPPISTQDRGLIVDVEITLDTDGSVLTAEVQNKQRLSFDRPFRVAAEEVMRTILKCSPLPIPPEKYEQWKTFTFSFNPKYAR